MQFNSLAFAILFLLILIVMRVSPLSWGRWILLVASCLFYGAWDWRFLPLLWTAIVIDYIAGLRIAPDSGRSDTSRKLWFAGSVIAQLAMLGFFKYAGFILQNVHSILTALGLHVRGEQLNIILPLGISFYTFKTLSYTADVYRGNLQPARSFSDYALHVSFFLTMVAGPIERARSFLPQLPSLRPATKESLMEGAHLILWGLFKKVFVADNVAILVDRVFDQAHPSGFSSLIGAYSFALQLFCDFSGYTDMARGCAKCLGLELSENFRHPYLAVSPSDFWQRWHMTLSTWLRDYVFRSLGGAFRSPLLAYRNLAITMILAGLWHGASWTYIFWGAYWAVLLVGHRVLQPVMKRRGQWFRRYMPKSTRKLVKIVVTAHLVCFGWLVFRAESLTKAWTLAVALLRWQGATDLSLATPLLRFGALYLVMELVFVLLGVGSTRRLSRPLIWLRPVFYALLIYFTAFYGAGSQAFIYAQF